MGTFFWSKFIFSIHILLLKMNAYGGLGPMTNGVLWMEVVLISVFVGLRLYTRHQIMNAVGIDDYLCSIAWVSKDHSKTLLSLVYIHPGF